MNTPRTKQPLRFGRMPKHWRNIPDGRYASGLWKDDFVLAVGRIVTYFPLLERGMSEVMAELIGGADPPVQQVFYSITNQQARIKVMRSLLQEAQINQRKDRTWDLLVDDFASISSSRSDYVHGIWWTHDSGRIFLEQSDPSYNQVFNRREVNLNELNQVIEKMGDLATRLRQVSINRFEKIAAQPPQDMPADASPDTSPPSPNEGSS